MYLPDSLQRQALSQLLDGFLTFPKMIRLVADILELIQFGDTLDNKQQRVSKS